MAINTLSIYTKDFTYKNIDGTEGTIRLRPLTGKDYPKLMKIVAKLDVNSSNPEDMTKAFDEETTADIIEICKTTILRSEKDVTEELVDEFVVSHLFELFPVIFELNFKSGEVAAKNQKK